MGNVAKLQPLAPDAVINTAWALADELDREIKERLTPEEYSLVDLRECLSMNIEMVAGHRSLGAWTPEMARREFAETFRMALDQLMGIEVGERASAEALADLEVPEAVDAELAIQDAGGNGRNGTDV